MDNVRYTGVPWPSNGGGNAPVLSAHKDQGRQGKRSSQSDPDDQHTLFRPTSLTLSSKYLYYPQITMRDMKKKKKGAGEPPVNNNRSDHKSSKPSSAVVSPVNNSNQSKGSKGKK